MHIVNGVWTLTDVYLESPKLEYKVSTYTADHNVNWNQTGHTLVMNSTDPHTFTMPEPISGKVGTEFTLVNSGTGKLSIAVTGTGAQIADCTAGTGSIYNNTTTYADITIRLVSLTRWTIKSGHGVWTTT